MTVREKLAAHDRQPMTMANASKEAWECNSYDEWVASLPASEQPEPTDDGE